ncbi:unnamed protein product [Sphagnum jensenii]|uniref:Uncharacterized protein n=1 Tax=Sphagnum jensenii TaxID=128206 RepID=A0ABP1AMB5_9BRYO
MDFAIFLQFCSCKLHLFALIHQHFGHNLCSLVVGTPFFFASQKHQICHFSSYQFMLWIQLFSTFIST